MEDVDLVCLLGNSAIFECKIKGEPAPTLTWSTDGRLIVENKKYEPT